MLSKAFLPRLALVTNETKLVGPTWPFIDTHNHLGEFGGGWDASSAAEIFDHIERIDVAHYVDLDGGWSEDSLHFPHLHVWLMNRAVGWPLSLGQGCH